MVTVLRTQGLRVVIFTDDHDPAHVHDFGDGETKINLLGPNGEPALVCAAGASRSEVRVAMRIVVGQQQSLLAQWEKIHGRPD